MADLHCTKCGEPWEMDCLSEPGEYGLTVKGSRIVSCSACAWHAERGNLLAGTAAAAAAMHDILGDDIDGVASMMQDYRD
jgi:Zn-finger protein